MKKKRKKDVSEISLNALIIHVRKTHHSPHVKLLSYSKPIIAMICGVSLSAHALPMFRDNL